jgi:undecaprenyl-diphosphatase
VNLSQSLILGLVEGVTEFLPVSSTGHMILVKEWMGLEHSAQLEAFLIVIQVGAILAVVTVFWRRFLGWINGWLNIIRRDETQESNVHFQNRRESLFFVASVVPFAIVGYLIKDFVKLLFSVNVVAWALITGAFLIFLVEWLEQRKTTHKMLTFSELTFKKAVLIGCCQCLALWPGFSRSAATILGSRMLGFERKDAAEISFLMGFPALFGTALYETLKNHQNMSSEWVFSIVIGSIVAWITAVVCVKALVRFLQRYSLVWFAWYRLLLGSALLIFL